MTKIFCDIAEKKLIKIFNKKKIVKGFTTNPSLVRKAGAKDYSKYLREILKITNTILGSNLFWDPVVVAPTAREIAEATSEITISDLDNSEEERRCPITMERFSEDTEILKINQCGHCFTKNALLRWFRNHVSCPVCRLDIRNTEENSATETAENVNPVLPQTLRFDFILDQDRQG